MGTITEKLDYLRETKSEIRAAIEEKGVTVVDEDTLRSYAEKISMISGSSTGSEATIDDYLIDDMLLLVDSKDDIAIQFGDELADRQAVITDVTHENDGLVFNGSSSWINCGAINPNYMTLEALVKFDAVGGDTEEAYAVAGNWQAGGFGIQQKNGKYACNVNVAGTWYHLYGSTVIIREIVYLAVTYDGSTVKFYENGVLKESATVSGVVQAPTNDTVFSVGSNPKGSEIGIDSLDGTLYAVRLHSSALSASQISYNYSIDFQRHISKSNGTQLMLLDGCVYNSNIWNANANSKKQNSTSIITEFFDVNTRTTNASGCRGLYLPTNNLKSVMFTEALPISGYNTIHFNVTMNPYFTSSYNWAHTYLMLCSSTSMSNVFTPANKIKEAVVWTSASGGTGTAYVVNQDYVLDLTDITADNVYLCVSHCDAMGVINKIWLE